MKYSFTKIVFILIAACLVSTTTAQADTISTLFNTGVDSAGVTLPNGTVGDPHYALTSVPGESSTILVRSEDGGFPIPPYLADNNLSRWIGPYNDDQLDGPSGAFVYHTTFDLSGFNTNTANISGFWSTDNAGVDIKINGTSLGLTTSEDSFLTFTPFSITSGFISGVNALDFYVSNTNGPTALRVEMKGFATIIPIPSALWLFGSGVLATIGSIKRRKYK